MADNQSTIALNIGTQRVSLAVFEPTKSGGVVLKSFDAEAVLADPAAEAARVSQIGRAIAALVSRSGVKGKVRYAVSGQSVFIRFVKLPPLDDDNIEQLVTFEAQQHVPFPLNEVVWDYEILEAAGEKEVVIVAIKSDALDEVNEAVNAAGLGTAEVDVAPLALYNAFRAAYPDVVEPVLLIDVGAKTSDLLYIEGNRFFTRSANVGGVAVTAAIAKEFNVSFAEAEAHKTQTGMVALGGGHTGQLDEATAALAVCIRNAMTRLATEIPRTTNYYRSQHSGNAPKLVFLAGGGANLPYAKEFFEEKLRLPVQYFNPLPAISVGKGVDVERVSKEAHLMGELIGLGLRGAGKSKLNIDLVPAKVGEARAAEKRKPFLIAGAVAIMLGAALSGFFKSQAADTASKKADEAKAQLQQLQSLSRPIANQVKKRDELKGIAATYVDSDASRIFWIDALSELSEAFGSDALWFTDLDPIANYNPFDEKAPGKSVVKADFVSASFGTPCLDNLVTKVPVEGRVRRGQPTEVEVPAKINALRIKGFWLNKSGVSANTVFALLDRLGENIKDGNSHFTFTVKDENGEDVTLEKTKLAPSVQADPAEGEFAAPFELVIPLAQPIPYR